jgi:hypothetical protein
MHKSAKLITGHFRPELSVSLTPLQLNLAGAPNILTITDTATLQQSAMAPRLLGLKGPHISTAAADA